MRCDFGVVTQYRTQHQCIREAVRNVIMTAQWIGQRMYRRDGIVKA